MAIGIIDLLEVIEVNHRDRQRSTIATHARQFFFGEFKKVAAIDQIGQKIPMRLPFKTLHQLGALSEILHRTV